MSADNILTEKKLFARFTTLRVSITDFDEDWNERLSWFVDGLLNYRI